MRTRSKRLFSILLAVCMLLSVAVPAAFAEEAEGVLNYSFTSKDGTASSQMAILTWGDSVSACTIYNDGAGIPTPDYPESSSPWAYAGRSLSGKLKTEDGNRVVIKQNYTQVFFSEKSAASGTNGDWMALKLVNVPAGTYKMTFTGVAGAGAGLADVFVMPYSEYSAIDAAYVSLTQENAAEVYPLVNDGMKTLLADKAPIGVFDSSSADAQIMELYTVAEAGDYILVFRCSAGQSAKEDSRLYVSALEMAPASAVELVEAQIASLGEITAESEAAVSAARAAYNALTDDQKALVSNYETLTAAEEVIAGLKKLNYAFKSAGGTIKVRTWGDGGSYVEPAFPAITLFGSSKEWTFAGRSLSGNTGTADGTRVNITSGGFIGYFSEKSAQSSTNGDWIALKLANVAAGTYTMTFAGNANSGGGVADVFVIPASEYAAIYADYMSLTEENAETVRPAVNNGMKALLANKEPVGQFDSRTGVAQAIGFCTCENTGDYILVFRCAAGLSAKEDSRLELVTLEMTVTSPAELVDALIDEIGTVTAESGAAIKAARDAYNALDDAMKAKVTKFDVLAAADEAYAAMFKLNYQFKTKSGTTKIRTWGDGGSYTEPEFPALNLSANSLPWTFVGRSLSGKTGTADGTRVNITSSNALTVYFTERNAKSSTDGDWIALKLTDVPAGEFKLIMTSVGASDGGKADVFMMPESDYAAVYADYMSLTEENAETVRPAVNEGMKTLLAGKEMVGVFDSTKAKAQTIGVYNCEAAGDYILVFRCSAGQTNENNRMYLMSLEMKYPTILDTVNAAQIGNQTYASLDAALAACENGDVISMNCDATVGELIIPAAVELDLNGYTLVAESVSAAGSIVDYSEGDTGVLKTADLSDLSAMNSELPLYDNAVEGYRFFKQTVESKAVTGNKADSGKYWFTLGFENQETVCALIANGDSGLFIGAQLVWDEQENDVIATADAEFAAMWAAAVSANPNCYITYTVTGISEETPNFRVVPFVGSGNVICAGEEMA